MPVKFYPELPIESLERLITKEDFQPLYGEIDIYRKLFEDLSKSSDDWHVWHDLKLPSHSITLNPYQKTSAQIDFLIICQQGILVLEVKGGGVSLKDNQFYYGNNFEHKMDQNPFKQAEGYKYTMLEKILNTCNKFQFCHAVAFPHVEHEFSSKLIEPQILWTKRNNREFGGSIEKFLLSVFAYNRVKSEKYRTFALLTSKDKETILRILNPKRNDLNSYFVIDTTEWLKVDNLEILDGLGRNNRVMIEGGPGTGKTTFAKAYIDKQGTKKGLYLCWNNLLMSSFKQEIHSREHNLGCEVFTLTRFLLKMNPALNPTDLLQYDENQFYEAVKKTVELSKANGDRPYDYIVVDEAQDIFDKGADLLINEYSGALNDGLTNGRCLLLYDIDQSYGIQGRDVLEISHLLSGYFAHFKLNEVKRSSQSPAIRSLSKELLEDVQILKKENFHVERYDRIHVHYFKDIGTVKNHIVNKILNGHLRNPNSSLKGTDCVLLIESSLLYDSYKNEPGMRYWLMIKDVEELSENNITETSNKLWYTSILKYKGLEKKNVFLVVTDPAESNKYELYIGITRAILNLEIFIVE